LSTVFHQRKEYAERLDHFVQTEVDGLRSQLAEMTTPEHGPDDDWRFTNSAGMRAIKTIIDNVAATDVTVLVSGESGVGKEMILRALHAKSARRAHPFVKVNCAALPLELLESELFGYDRGAFTGAHRQKAGKFEAANKGTIFLDEIGDIPWPLQAKLLHVLQDREFSRLGSAQTVRVEARVVAATNQDLAHLVQQRLFREDLYYRLNVVNVRVPPLRRRREEIPLLVDYFLRRFSQQYGRQRTAVSAETMRRFMAYPWPGNIRELENTIKRIVVLGTETWVADEFVIGEGGSADEPAPVEATGRRTVVDDGHDIAGLGLKQIGRRAAARAERIALQGVLEDVHWNRMEAARRLKVNYKTILSKIAEYGIA
jgi:two-component system, NtrC family, response regulator AtoC